MRRALGIIGIIVVWVGIAAYVVVAGNYSRSQRVGIVVKEVRVAINDSSATKVINPAMVSRWIKEGGFEPVGKPIDEVDSHAIENFIAQHTQVRHVSVWSDLNGILTVLVSQRTPIMRIRSSNGYRFWITDDNYILPDRGDFPAYVPVITGNTPFPFSTGAKGSYDEIVDGNYRDFLGQYTEIDAERRSITSQRSAKRALIRETRLKRTKRFWSKERKERFNNDKKRHIAEMQEEVVRFDDYLVALYTKKDALCEKEKKSQQSHHFLTKLVNFVKSIENDDFWSVQIVQINIFGGGTINGSNVWREPQVELIPRAGDHIILLGQLDGNEGKRMDKLKLFYRDGLWHQGWEEYSYINIKYTDQIVCTK